ncbi:hypothetical protein FQA39_LY03776 [Lamprigera yunnana]|nr:hypothetical protein FQA39_LY03776 [Lamprigera yunnana]
MLRILFVAVLSTFICFFGSVNCNLIIDTKLGKIKGKFKYTINNRTFSAFTGIPYAKPPTGNMRYEPAVPISSWVETLEATAEHNVCPQPNIFKREFEAFGDEDCLYLNVYTPKMDANQTKSLYPVIVYIHGGSFVVNSASYDWLGPEILLNKDIVLVTVNYRLGALGFLSTGDHVVPGNNGLKDQALALEWVHNNIRFFGGNESKVTIMGNSAGASSAQYHTISPLSKHLIQGAIFQSGSAIAPFAICSKAEAIRNAYKLGEYLNCSTLNSNELVKCLRNVNIEDILRQQSKYMEWDIEPVVLFKPVMEPDIEGAFMTIDPYETIAKGKSADVPFMTGVTLNEGDFRAEQLFEDLAVANVFKEDMEKKLPVVLDYKYTAIPKYSKSATESLQTYYFKKNFNKRQFSKLYMDAFYLFSANAAAETHSTYLKQPIYYYAFGYKGSETYCKYFNTTAEGDHGICHSDDLLYLFDNNEEFPDYVRNDSENDMADLLTKLWTNFAKYGNPTPEDSELQKWEPYTINKSNHYIIKDSKNIENAAELYEHRSRFWKNLKLEGRTLRINDEFCVNLLLASEDPPQITIKQGKLQGGIGRTRHDRLYYYFTGIPYAKPPLGWYRFEPPIAPIPWNNTLDATLPSPVCVQFESRISTNIIGSEDCLYLNIYTPQLPTSNSNSLPVMFYIGGEYFMNGDVSKERYGPEFLLDKDVVLVTINYRLGPFGFFVTEGDTVKTNAGLRDQARALKWVHKNIEAFGGDPNKITLFGQGAGGASAHFLMISSSSKNMISGVIAESGLAIEMWAYAPIPVIGLKCRLLAGMCKCPVRGSQKDMIECLKALKSYDIMEALNMLKEDNEFHLFRPVLERHTSSGFLDGDPVEMIQNKLGADVPLLTGITSDEGALEAQLLLNNPKQLDRLNTDFEQTAPIIFYYGYNAVVKDRKPISEEIRNFYFRGSEINEGTKSELTKLYTDVLFLDGLRYATELHARYYDRPVYKYLFSYKGTETYMHTINATRNGVCHGDELLYLFKNTVDFPNYQPSKSDEEMTDLLVTLWTNFAIYGNPTPPEDSSLNFKWEPFKEGNENYLHIIKADTVKIKQNMLAKRANLWKKFPILFRRDTIKDEL